MGKQRLRGALPGQRRYDPVPDEVDQSGYAWPEAPSCSDYVLHPYRSMRDFFRRLVSEFGWKFTCMIGCNYFAVKGMLLSIMGLVRLSYCKKTLNIDGSQCQTLGAIASTPWAIKGATIPCTLAVSFGPVLILCLETTCLTWSQQVPSASSAMRIRFSVTTKQATSLLALC